jgi:uncharacterized protein (TIGR00255 family)
MTGFGKTIAETPQKKITIEIKSLNSRQLDLNTKLPWLYREKEPEIRNLISQKLDRGKIELSIYFDILGDEGVPVINKAIVKNYYKQLKEISYELNLETEEQYISAILRLPEAMKTERPELTEAEWELVKAKLIESINMVDFYRTDEGKSIEKDIRDCLKRISESLEKVEDFEPERIIRVREKLVSILAENTASENIDKNRFEQELIFYLEKFDINEEKVRLRKHCEYFIQTMDSDAPNGRKLNFIAQEIGREVNTIGSKANDASIQKLVVMMKDELEKIKEQTGNIL